VTKKVRIFVFDSRCAMGSKKKRKTQEIPDTED